MSHFRGRRFSEVLEAQKDLRGKNLMVGVVFSEKKFWSWKSRCIHSPSPVVLQKTKTQKETKEYENPSKF